MATITVLCTEAEMVAVLTHAQACSPSIQHGSCAFLEEPATKNGHRTGEDRILLTLTTDNEIEEAQAQMTWVRNMSERVPSLRSVTIEGTTSWLRWPV